VWGIALKILRLFRKPSLLATPNLWLRLLLTHALVMALGIVIIATISNIFTTNFADPLIAAVVSLISVCVVSFLVSLMIRHPLERMEAVVHRLAAGELDVRMPISRIPEINRLGVSFNHMAVSLQDIEQRRHELTSDLAHELRTPVTVIHGYLEMLNDSVMEITPEIRCQLLQEAGRLQRLISSLLELSKVEAGYLPLNLQSYLPQPLMQEVLSIFAIESQKVNCDLKLKLPAYLPNIYADPDRFKQVLINLVSNAITYSQNGNVTIRARSDVDYLWIDVTDTGIGIAPDDVPRVFDRFWRADRSRNLKTGGSGIGLAIVKRLVELQGGNIEVESELNKGSTFRFSIPLE